MGTVALILVAFYLLRDMPKVPDPPPVPGAYAGKGGNVHAALKLGEDGQFKLSWRDGLLEDEGTVEAKWEASGSFVTLRADAWSGPPPEATYTMGLPGRKVVSLMPPAKWSHLVAGGSVVSIHLHRVGP